MAEFSVETRISHPLADVFTAYRDELPKLAAFIPNVREVTVLERKEEGGVVRFVNKWRAAAEVPAAIKSVITEDKLSWLDHAAWDDAQKKCNWTLEITAFKDAVTCKGETRFHDQGAATRVTISGSLQVDASKAGIPIPRFLAGSIGKTIETFAVALIKPNQEALGPAVARYLDQKKKGG